MCVEKLLKTVNGKPCKIFTAKGNLTKKGQKLLDRFESILYEIIDIGFNDTTIKPDNILIEIDEIIRRGF